MDKIAFLEGDLIIRVKHRIFKTTTLLLATLIILLTALRAVALAVLTTLRLPTAITARLLLSATVATRLLATALIITATQHLHLIGDNLSDIALVAVTVIIRAGLNFALDINLLPLVKKLTADFSQLAPGNNIMPFCFSWRLPSRSL